MFEGVERQIFLLAAEAILKEEYNFTPEEAERFKAMFESRLNTAFEKLLDTYSKRVITTEQSTTTRKPFTALQNIQSWN